MKDHYATLEIASDASPADIRSAFKKLAVQYHPDKNGGDVAMEERFKEINHAYQVLSSPYEKARYDLQRSFGFQQPAPEPPPPPYQKPPPYWYEQTRHYKPHAPIDYRENWIATLYAFGFTLIMATIVMGVMYTYRYLENRELNELLAHRREQFELAKEKYRVGEVDQALVLINELGKLRPSERDIAEYKKALYESFARAAEDAFNKHDFLQTIYYLELIEKYAPSKPLPYKEILADAYLASGLTEQAIHTLRELLPQDYRTLALYVKLARIYQNEMDDPQEALQYYETASNLAIKNYKATYGEGYPLVISGRQLPKEHYQLYTGLALALLQNGHVERSIKAAQWNIRMWPDSVANYILAAKGYHESGNDSQACKNAREAQKRGYLGGFDFSCR